jgi:prepilin-type N-terminal cleavage/methylation domain-containing protein/prepilin-type processing-associated H-X9-DG protein
MRNTKRGFTLIELLVVIAIIAILAAILFPVFAKVREKARQTSCLSNEKQLGLAFAQYYEDYDEKWPSGATGGTTAATEQSGFGWAGTVYPYVKSAGLYKCPDDSTTATTFATYTVSPVSYGFNSNAAGVADAQFTSPASTVTLFEVQGATANLSSSWASTSATSDGISANGVATPPVTDASFADNGLDVTATAGIIFATSNFVGRSLPTAALGAYGNQNALHTGGANYLLADGHAKWFRGNAVSAGYNATVANTYQNITAAGDASSTDYSGGGGATEPATAATFSLL